MKRILVLAAAGALLLSCHSGKTVFSGVIEGYNGEFTEFFLPDSTVEGGFREIVIEVAEDGTFSQKIELPKSYYDAPFFVDKFMFRLSVEKGKTYKTRFDITVPEVETNFEFYGEGAAENLYTRDWHNGFGVAWMFLRECSDITSFQDYKSRIEAKVSEYASKLDTVGSEGFKSYYRTLLDETRTSYLAYYPFAAINCGIEPENDADYQAFVAEDGFASMSDKEFAEYFNSVSSMIAGTFMDMDILKVVKVGQTMVPDASRGNFIMTSLLTTYMNYGGDNNLKAAYEYYKAVCKDPGYVSQVDNIYKTSSVLVKGADAPEIEFVDVDGKKYTLADFKGKALYVDMWASWCGPCCAEIPYLEELYKNLGPDAAIQCISISIDEGRQDWLDKLEEEAPAWPQYLVTEKGQAQVAGDYNIRSIPRFMLFDDQGKIVTVNAPRPSTPDIRKILEDLLK